MRIGPISRKTQSERIWLQLRSPGPFDLGQTDHTGASGRDVSNGTRAPPPFEPPYAEASQLYVLSLDLTLSVTTPTNSRNVEWLERVKGIEPSYSAWKAAALPLSYTRARQINYHAGGAASTADAPAGPLNRRRFPAYTDVSINTTKGGDPVSFTKRCHLAGIAR
jgi:hypothetical protein